MTHRLEAKHVPYTLNSRGEPTGDAVTANAYTTHTYIVGLEKAEKANLYLHNTDGANGLHYRIDYSPGEFWNTGLTPDAVDNLWVEHTAEATLAAAAIKLDFDFTTPYDGAMKIRIQIKSAVSDTPATFRMYCTTRGTL